jgi:prepilin-type N-terminal cleavage/methylation domain-containing protein
MVKRRKRSGQAGFVLIEVLVAVGIASVLMAVLMRAFVNTWAGVSIVRDEAEGTLLARSLIEEILLRGQIQAGTQEGTLGRYAWTIGTSMQTVAVIAPPIKPQGQSQNQSQGQAQRPQGQGQGQGQAQGDQKTQPQTATIYHVAVVMRGPSGRSNRLDAFKIGPPTR